MTFRNLQTTHADQGDKPSIHVLPLGIASTELERLSKTFQHAPASSRKYLFNQSGRETPVDVLLVNYDDAEAVQAKDNLLQSQPDIPVVALSRGPLVETQPYHIKGMLIGIKVLSLLDKIPLGIAPANLEITVKEVAIATVETTTATGFRALVVDDSAAIQKSLELHLRGLPQIGVVDFAETGEEALQKVESAQYDLIFLDVMMPGIDGYEACTRIRRLPQYKKTPIIMVSGKNSPLDEVKGVIAGCTTYLTKPVQEEAFVKLSQRVLAWLDNYHSKAR